MTSRFATSLAVFGAAVALTGWIGGRFTAQGIRAGWYAALAKPDWTPPGWLIGTVWTILYVCIALASALLWRSEPYPPYAALLALNLALNAYWCRLFFSERRPGAAFVEILVLDATCILLVVLASRRSSVAAGLLAPYAAWVAFASFLNDSIVRLQ
ncbi:MAG TPA: TspO/MBR family protein [Thermoanaerobaculia bacterium]|nr:TspO/MBR family protein [Thermoanaerobaculia bacterium]